MARLYVVGNGFDIHHRLDTRFSDFENYLKTHNQEILDTLYRYYFTEGDQDLWSEFEHNLANLDKDDLLEHLSEYLPDISRDDFSDRDWHSSDIESTKYLTMLTTSLRSEFSRFILNAETKVIDKVVLLHIDPSAKFISFNYTSTLENQYHISPQNVLHIHGIANEEDRIVLGHATDPAMFIEQKVNQTPPEGISEIELECWYEWMSDQHNPQYESLVDDVNSYFSSSFKDTNRIIKECSEYFNSLYNVNEIYVLGHSMSDVDLTYFEKLVSSLHPECHWHVSYHGDEEDQRIAYTLKGLNIKPEKFTLIKLVDLNICI
jgi:hypothetical protein